MSVLNNKSSHSRLLFPLNKTSMKAKPEFNGSVSEIQIHYKHKIASSERPMIKTSKDAADILRPLFLDFVEHREAMYALYLNRANRVQASFLIGLGGVTGVVADPKIIFQGALKCNACGVILAHNHPSGNRTPSQADLDLTKKVKEGASLLELSLLDHLIIMPDQGYFSFADEGHL